jgi:hypothetical protein
LLKKQTKNIYPNALQNDSVARQNLKEKKNAYEVSKYMLYHNPPLAVNKKHLIY